MMEKQKFRQHEASLRRDLEKALVALLAEKTPRELTDACRYVIASGGKRVRAVLLLLACQVTGGTVRKAIPAAVAVELLHNFTLVHDDVMDNAPSRRGLPTVHTKWSLSQAILVGDILLGHAYRSLLRTRGVDESGLARVFTEGLVGVCVGQGLDLELGKKKSAVLEDYFAMVEMKTARLIILSAELGGIVSGASEREMKALRSFGKHLGRAFQIQDDLLDATADHTEFGKRVGGDILEGKQTFLHLTALERAAVNDRTKLETAASRAELGNNQPEIIEEVRSIYRTLGVLDEARSRVASETKLAIKSILALKDSAMRRMLQWYALKLVQRAS